MLGEVDASLGISAAKAMEMRPEREKVKLKRSILLV
jgi:hypothetical protein